LEPHIYKTPFAGRIVFISVGSLLIACGLFFVATPIWASLAWIFIQGSKFWAFAFTSVLGCCGVGLGAALIIASITGHVDLYPDAIVVGSALPFGNRRLERKEIGAKMITFIYVTIYVLYPRARDQKPLRIGMQGSEDDYFREWMDSIPNADAEFLRRRFWRRRAP
jgi:hypothetical protein